MSLCFPSVFAVIFSDRRVSETVIAVMLRSFRFSLGEKEIYWNMAGVNYPTVGKTSEKPAAFLRLERISA